MHSEEQKLIEEICKKYDIDIRLFQGLINIEREYANKNMGRRGKIFVDLNEILDFWTMR